MIVLSTNQHTRAAELFLSSLRLGFTIDTISGVDVNDARAAQELWLRTALQNMNKNNEPVDVQITVYSDLSLLINAVKEHELDAVTLLPLEYLSLQEDVSLIPIITSYSGDSDGEHYVVLTHRENNIQTIEQLQSRNIIVGTRGDKKVPQLWLDTMLLEKSLPETKAFFKSVKYMRKTTQAILPVFFKQVDACLVPKTDFETAIKLNPQLSVGLQIIAESPGFKSTMTCLRSDFHDQHGSHLTQAMETINQTEQGKQFFTLFRVSRILRFEEVHLDNIKNLLQKNQTLSQKSAHRQIEGQ
ncbi:MAG: PhnD/SsuA/transferrin family substrate-binding protein [Candidatus Latescibacteria bacterium]|nr:PhnD/SsuA/transferrin family substrate-binding protein [Candidatus Latescibacterota bacterium]MBT5828576.1 PhnD/SsuA/transferrin family substrate-binding protein [Candidatus Latescibacterota bacterium]